MKRLKRFFVCCVAVLMLGALLSACGAKNEEQKDGGMDSFAIVAGGVEIALGADAAPILSQLGEPQSVQEVFDCGAGNSRMWYRFSSFDLFVMKDGKNETVDQIELHDDLISTKEGICIGSTEEKVREVYSDCAVSEQAGRLIFTKGDTLHLAVDVENGAVKDLMLKRDTQ